MCSARTGKVDVWFGILVFFGTFISYLPQILKIRRVGLTRGISYINLVLGNVVVCLVFLVYILSQLGEAIWCCRIASSSSGPASSQSCFAGLLLFFQLLENIVLTNVLIYFYLQKFDSGVARLYKSDFVESWCLSLFSRRARDVAEDLGDGGEEGTEIVLPDTEAAPSLAPYRSRVYFLMCSYAVILVFCISGGVVYFSFDGSGSRQLARFNLFLTLLSTVILCCHWLPQLRTTWVAGGTEGLSVPGVALQMVGSFAIAAYTLTRSEEYPKATNVVVSYLCVGFVQLFLLLEILYLKTCGVTRANYVHVELVGGL